MKKFCLLMLLVLSFSCKRIQPPLPYYAATSQPVPSEEIFPGIPAWNHFSTGFIYAPVFRLDSLEDAKYFDCLLTSEPEGKTISWTENQPVISLSSYWADIPAGMVDLTVKALKNKGDTTGVIVKKKFYRAAPFAGIPNAPRRNYKDAGVLALKYIYNLPHVQRWLTSDEPDLSYSLYGYPAKIVSALINSMLTYSSLPSTPGEDSVKAMKIALKMAGYTVKISDSRNLLLAPFCPTYNTEFVAKRIKNPDITNDNGVNGVVASNAGRLMMLYGYEYATAILNLYDRTKDIKWLDRAVDIADAYKALQLPDGSWYLKLDFNTARPADSSLMIPARLMMFLKRLETQYHKNNYESTIDKADQWIRENPMKTFFWEGQFEDVPSFKIMYRNLSEYPATDYAMYLLHYKNEAQINLPIAQELIRFAEDQFIIWTKPPQDFMSHGNIAGKDPENWLVPCVLEQYVFYVPVDASACQMINSFMDVYQVTRDSTYLWKATALANSLTQAQQDDGEITTVWTRDGFRGENWLNCMTFSAETLLHFNEMLNTKPSP
jgi:hypothetical protein